MLNRESFLAGFAPKTEKVECPEFGEGQFVYVRTMLGRERDAFEAEQVARGKKGNALDNFRARILMRTVCDESGNPLFKPGDENAIGEIPSNVILRITDVALRLNGFGEEAVAELEKN